LIAIAFDHFYWQDLDELDRVMGPNNHLVRISYARWHRIARTCFPKEAFDGIENAFDPKMNDCWKKYCELVKKEVAWIIAAHQPNIFIAPSDAFFYIRPFIESFKEAGLNTFVMQKETTISPLVMDEHSKVISKFIPFMSDHMTVCSERHKQFWLKAGTNAHLISVTGQPRFDIYRRPRECKPGNVDIRPKLLYLSYADDAYLPSDLGIQYSHNWQQQRQETERTICDLSSSFSVTVKKHPQQLNSEDWLGSSIVHADRFADTRKLIIESDVVVGFQTTALYEAAVAGKPVIYAAWGETFESAKDLLIRFDLHPDLVTHANSPEHLRFLLTDELPNLSLASDHGLEVAETELGPVDGQAAERTWAIIQTFLQPAPPADVTKSQLVKVSRLLIISTLYGIAEFFTAYFAPSFGIKITRRNEILKQRLKEKTQIKHNLKELSSHEKSI
jgi:hypothetical protein